MVELDRNEKRDKRLVVIFDIKEEDIKKLHGHIATRWAIRTDINEANIEKNDT